MKARILAVATVCLLCAACGAPSLRHKKEINKLMIEGNFPAAAEKVEVLKDKMYTSKDRLLYYLDAGAVLHDAQKPAESDEKFDEAQRRVDELFARSVSGNLGRLFINDLTMAYYPADYETALTYYYRAMNFLQRQDLTGALVEVRKAVYFLDYLRRHKAKGYNDDPFVQYFASVVFESGGDLNGARIARVNAMSAFAAQSKQFELPSHPRFNVPANANELTEIILIHYNGLLPLKKSQTFQVGWDQALLWASSPEEGDSVSPEAQNALTSAIMGKTITVAWPVFEEQPFLIQTSEVSADGQVAPTILMSNVAALAKQDLKDRMPGIMFRLATRAVSKQVLREQARQAAKSATDNDVYGDVAGMIVDVFGSVVEKADTRQWFTLPAQIRMSRLFVRPGTKEIRLRFKDGFGNIIGEYVFEGLEAKPGGRIFLHYRTAR